MVIWPWIIVFQAAAAQQPIQKTRKEMRIMAKLIKIQKALVAFLETQLSFAFLKALSKVAFIRVEESSQVKHFPEVIKVAKHRKIKSAGATETPLFIGFAAVFPLPTILIGSWDNARSMVRSFINLLDQFVIDLAYVLKYCNVI